MSIPLRVLIVEDSEDDAILLIRELKRGGYEVTFERVETLEDMNLALETQDWDIVLSDYSMPHFSMSAALTLVKEKKLDIPFVIVSGAIGEEAAVSAMRAGAHDYVIKGNMARLIPVIERELREAEMRREHRQMENEKKQIEQQLQLAGRLAAVGELAAGVAHELNNPLAAVQAYSELLASRKDLDESIKKDIDTIYREAQRATKITGNLLSFARRHRPEKSIMSINEAIIQSVELHSYRMNVNNIEVATELYPDLPYTLADFGQMQQVFVNLITNAEQAMTESHGKGKLTIKTKVVNNMIHITFTDNGPGIPDENLERIFDPFFTTKEVGKGTGLGLSICFGLIQGHNGRLYATNNPEGGATFIIEVPVIMEMSSAIDNTNSSDVIN